LQPPTEPLAVLMPKSVEEVAAMLALCHRHGQPIAVQGGLTGLVAGGHPLAGEVALSLEKLTGIEEIDTESSTLTALAGTPLQVIQQAAEEAGLICAIDLGARGSATIGGNVSTNAGGNQVLRYGMTRRNVLGLEVVLADGTVVTSLNKMMKNNAGYDWMQLFIGSEGTLGVVTRVVLQLHPWPQGIETALIAVDGAATALKLLRALEREAPNGLLVFEAMWREFYARAVDTIGLAPALPLGSELYLLVEAPMGAGGRGAFEDLLGSLSERGLIADAVIAGSGNERARLWAFRESIYHYIRHWPLHVSYDISLPLNRMAEGVDALRAAGRTIAPDVEIVIFGHLADSNLHIVAYGPENRAELPKLCHEAIYRTTRALGGSISAEHGIGRVKKPYLPLSRSPAELALMRTLKQALDPAGILNPGRVI
jgi:FAD/FMN-containing dehydrogenase